MPNFREIFRSSHRSCSVKSDNLCKIHRKTTSVSESFLLINLQLSTQEFYCEFCKSFQTPFNGTPIATAPSL